MRRAARGALVLVRRAVAVAVYAGLLPVVAAALVAAAVVTAPGRGRRRRAVRVLWVAVVCLALDLAGVAAACAVWLRSPPVTSRARARLTAVTYRQLEGLLGRVRSAAARAFGVRLEVTPPLPPGPRPQTVPLVLFVRHAGPGDSFLLVHTLLAAAGLRPHVVLKRILRLDPCLDILLGRVPHAYVPAPRGVETAAALGSLAAGLRPGDALVLFPEGGNFTERRRRHALAALRRLGLARLAGQASAMPHVLPPRTTGAFAVLDAAPGADVVFVAHTGLDTVDSVRSGWAALPLAHPVRAHWWRVPAARVPSGEAARTEWLMAQWARVDAWIAGHGPGDPDGGA